MDQDITEQKEKWKEGGRGGETHEQQCGGTKQMEAWMNKGHGEEFEKGSIQGVIQKDTCTHTVTEVEGKLGKKQKYFLSCADYAWCWLNGSGGGFGILGS